MLHACYNRYRKGGAWPLHTLPSLFHFGSLAPPSATIGNRHEKNELTSFSRRHYSLTNALHVFVILGCEWYNKVDIFVNEYPVEAVCSKRKKDAKCKNIK